MKETGTITKINQTGQYPTKDRDTKQPITMKIYSIDFKHLQNTTYYNPHDLKVQVGDFVEFEYNQADKKVSAIKKIVQPMHGNYKPDTNTQKNNYITAEDRKQNEISFANKLNVVAQLYSGKGNEISLDELHDKAVYLFNKQKPFN